MGQSDLIRHKHDLERCVARAEPFVVVYDLSRSSVPGARCRELLAGYRLEALALAEELLVGEAFVVTSRAHCGLVEALNQLAPLPHAQVFLRSRSEALAWARARLSACGKGPHPPSLRKSGITQRKEQSEAEAGRVAPLARRRSS
jgi:hypothetical protein